MRKKRKAARPRITARRSELEAMLVALAATAGAEAEVAAEAEAEAGDNKGFPTASWWPKS